ncbi:MAG: MerC domain-containing protein [Arenimonas sp.]
MHSALLPLAIALLPLAGLGGLASAGFEHGFLVFALLLGVSNLALSYRKHRVLHALTLLALGITLISTGIFDPTVHASTFWHAVTMTSVGLLIATAHLMNLKLMKVRNHPA